MSYQRGDIYYIKKCAKEIDSEQNSGRPGIIVSNDKLNRTSPVEKWFISLLKRSPIFQRMLQLTRPECLARLYVSRLTRYLSKGLRNGAGGAVKQRWTK